MIEAGAVESVGASFELGIEVVSHRMRQEAKIELVHACADELCRELGLDERQRAIHPRFRSRASLARLPRIR